MKKYRHIITIVLLLAVSLCSFYAFVKTIPSTNVPSVIITFDTNGGEGGTVFTTPPNTAISPVQPTKEGFEFLGWFASPDLTGNAFDFDTILSSDITLYAKWAPLSSPITSVIFGEYPQLLVTNPDTILALNNSVPSEGDYYLYNAKKYFRVIAENKGKAIFNGFELSESYYFEVVPIAWKILQTSGDNYVLITSSIIDCMPYHNTDLQITYEASDIRDFLNDAFYNRAFNSVQQAAIKPSAVINADNPTFQTPGGADTEDKVYLLSIDEATNGAYFDSNIARQTVGTAYAQSQGLSVNTNANFYGKSRWWLRSPGDYSFDNNLTNNNAASVDSNGLLTSIGSYITEDELGIRPVIFVPVSLFA